MNLSEAEVVVTTQKEIDKDNHTDDWFILSDYGDMEEFYSACCSLYPKEDNPVFRYPAWENIPDILINKEWFCPNFFEIRDALEQLEEPETDYFLTWCNYQGHNITVDDPHLLVTNYLDNHTSYPEFESNPAEIADDTFSYQNITSSCIDMGKFTSEIFGDNYD